MSKIVEGDRVQIEPCFDVYGMAGYWVHKIGTVKLIKKMPPNYIVAEIDVDNHDHTAIVQTKHLRKVNNGKYGKGQVPFIPTKIK